MFDCLLFCNKTYIKYISQIFMDGKKNQNPSHDFDKKRNKGNRSQ